ncbi:hypothetical protein GF324_08950 [bacterium]|nr:hypothetical protein [bacterium]
MTHTKGSQGRLRELLGRLPNVKLVELAESTICCGFGGSFSSVYPEEAGEWTQRKLDHIVNTGAPVAVAASPGCIEHMRGGLNDRRLKVVKIKHPAELIADRCGWL